MKTGTFKLNDINIGDTVFFSVKKADNLQSYWTVISKNNDGNVMVKFSGRDDVDDILINVKDIQALRASVAIN